VTEKFGKNAKRRTLIENVSDEQEFTEEDLIVAEDNVVLLTADGWVKRQKEIKDPISTRLREGDVVLACVLGSTRESLVFFSNFGTAYSCRMIDVPATTGYGEPIQKLFKLKDGEKIIACFSLDSRVVGDTAEREGKRPKTYAVAATSDGYAFTIGISPFIEPSTRAGRRYAKVSEGVQVVGVSIVRGKETVIAATAEGRALLCGLDEVGYLSGPGKGVLLVKLEKDDSLVGMKATGFTNDPLILETSLGGEYRVEIDKYDRSSRGGKGREVIKRGKFVRVVPNAPTAPEPLSN
jgi:DNA gyrase subunit A